MSISTTVAAPAVLSAPREQTRLLSWIDGRPLGEWSVSMLDAIDPRSLDKADLPTYIKACDRVESRFAAKRDRATLLLAGQDDRNRNFREVETPTHELCAPPRLPAQDATALRAGLITRKHVAKITTGTGRLTEDECAQVEVMALANAELLSVHEFARQVRRAVALVKPRSTKEQHDAAMGFLVSSMPLLDALTCKKAYDHYALSKKQAGDARPLGVLRVEGQRLFAVTPEALLGLTDTPAEIPGVGPIPIETVRGMIRDAKVRWLTVSGTNGALLDRNPKAWRIPAQVQAHADQAYVNSVGPHSTVPADRCDGEHLIRFPDGPTTIDNIVPMDRGWHIPKTHHSGMFLTRNDDGSLTWTTPLGQTVTVQPYDYRLGP